MRVGGGSGGKAGSLAKLQVSSSSREFSRGPPENVTTFPEPRRPVQLHRGTLQRSTGPGAAAWEVGASRSRVGAPAGRCIGGSVGRGSAGLRVSGRGRHSRGSVGSARLGSARERRGLGPEWVEVDGVGRRRKEKTGGVGAGRCECGGAQGAGPRAADVPSSAGKYRLCCHAGVSLMKIGIR